MPLFLGLSAGNALAVPYRLKAIHAGDKDGDSYSLHYGDACTVVWLPRRFALLPIRISHSFLGTFLARQLFLRTVV